LSRRQLADPDEWLLLLSVNLPQSERATSWNCFIKNEEHDNDEQGKSERTAAAGTILLSALKTLESPDFLLLLPLFFVLAWDRCSFPLLLLLQYISLSLSLSLSLTVGILVTPRKRWMNQRERERERKKERERERERDRPRYSAPAPPPPPAELNCVTYKQATQ
jgi:hypothetical protein